MQTRLLLRSLNRIFVFGINRTSGPSCRVLKQIRYETEKNNRYNNSAGGARPVAEDLGEDQHASRRDHNDNTRLVSPPLRGEQRRGLRDADRVDGGHRLGKVAADRVPNGHDRTSGLLHPLSGASRQGYAQRGDDRPRNDTRGRDRQPDRFGVLRRALLAVDAARGSALDMFYFPLFQWNNVPSWLSFLVDGNNYFFGAVFNLADAYISVAVVYLLLFHYKFFQD